MKLRISPDGIVRGLWNDDLDWRVLGQLDVRRASHVEFCSRTQSWCVTSGRSRNAFHLLLRRLLRLPARGVLFLAPTRSEALRWEAAYLGPGGPGWPEARERSRAAIARVTQCSRKHVLGASARRLRDQGTRGTPECDYAR